MRDRLSTNICVGSCVNDAVFVSMPSATINVHAPSRAGGTKVRCIYMGGARDALGTFMAFKGIVGW